MKRLVYASFFSLGLLGLSSSQVMAQLGTYVRPQYNSRPVISPYVNMVGGGVTGNPATAYFGIVRPQMQAAQNFQQLNNQFQTLQNELPLLGGSGMQPQQLQANNWNSPLLTGHPVMFMNYGFYYNFGQNGGGNGTSNRSMPTGTSSMFRR